MTYASFLSVFCNETVRKKKRKREGPKNKRGPTGYTLFFQETYNNIKKDNGDDGIDSKDVLMLIARQWNDIDDGDKEAWQCKAEQLKQAGFAAATSATANGNATAEMPMLAEAMEEVGSPEPPRNEEWGGKKRASLKSSEEEVTNNASV
jgi:hypothetical protein